MKGLKQLTAFGYAPDIPVQLLNIPRNPQNNININDLSEDEDEHYGF